MKYNILIVDDMNISRKLLIKALKLSMDNLEFFEASNGEEALEILKEVEIDLILLDLLMPIKNGYETLRELKVSNEYREIPVIVNSTNNDSLSIKEVLELGAIDYFIKPMSPEEMEIVIPLKVKNTIMYNKQRKDLELSHNRLMKEKKRLQALFKNSMEAIVYIDSVDIVIEANEKFYDVFGIGMNETIGRNLYEMLKIKEEKTNFKNLGENSKRLESMVCTKKGNSLDVVIKLIPITLDNILLGAYVVFEDITEKKRYEEQLKYLTLRDRLTDLYNRSYFEEELNRLQKSREFPISIIVVDIDGLKIINDTMGHAIGDFLIKSVGLILKRALRDSEIVARIGGDEFAVLLPSTDKEGVRSIVERIQYVVSEYNESNSQVPVSISIGAATTEKNNDYLEKVLNNADANMYQDKLRGSSRLKDNLMSFLMRELNFCDYNNSGHISRVNKLSTLFVEKLKLSSMEGERLRKLAVYHDIGKVGIPKEVLLKPDKLNDEEWKMIKQHSEKGYRMALYLNILNDVAELILNHHERWDGNGYPMGLRGDKIPIECRVFSIVDAFDCMTNDRHYRKKRSKGEALEEIKKNSGTMFQPELVDIFIELINEVDEV